MATAKFINQTDQAIIEELKKSAGYKEVPGRYFKLKKTKQSDTETTFKLEVDFDEVKRTVEEYEKEIAIFKNLLKRETND